MPCAFPDYAPDTRIVTPTTIISRASEDLGEAWAEKRHALSSYEKELTQQKGSKRPESNGNLL